MSCLLRKSFVHVKFSKRGILKKNRASLIDEKPCLFEFETQFIEKKYKLKKSRVTCFKFSKKKSRAISLKFSKKKSRLISSKSSKKKKMFLSLKNKRLKYIRSRLVKNYPLKKKFWIIKKKINTLNINNIFNVYQSTFTKYLLKNRLFKNLYLEVSYRRIKFLRFKTLQKFVRQKYKNW